MVPGTTEKNNNENANTEIDILISKIDSGIRNKSEFIRVIRDPPGLLKSLNELRDIIGNKLIKDSIADQISYIIVEKNSGTPAEEMMLNTILYGPPGVGKTLIGEKLAKIWVAIGYLEDPSISENKNTPSKSTKEQISKFVTEINNLLNGNSSSFENNSLFFFFTTLLFILFVAVLVVAFVYYRNSFSNFGIIAFTFVMVVLFIVLLLVIYYLTTNKNTVQIQENTSGLGDTGGVDASEATTNGKKVIKSVSRENFRRVTRSDLVDLYLGHTDKKTLKLLQESTGMVIFLDEIYQLTNGSQDQYGKEALNVINQYMSENPGKIIFIAAGYKEEIRDNLFAIQPGLERRFLWKFDCDGYTKTELFEIFEKQARDCNRHFEGDEYFDIKEYFLSEASCLKHFAADTKSLLHFTKLAHNKAFLNHKGKIDIHSLTIEDVENGFKAMKNHNVKEDSNPRMGVNKLYDYLAKAR